MIFVAPDTNPRADGKALSYLDADRHVWREYGTCALIDDGRRPPDLLVDLGTADTFPGGAVEDLPAQGRWRPGSVPAIIRMQQGCDHSYYFVSTVMAEHVAWHAQRLSA